ncbi:MAG: ABC-type transport auxiliary lipoprotein family protein [Marinobacter sp.]|uniref:ABC-type transport auxiliary lipoprotein family protein n=1 Tax=Marinobacter sp. TaxID=50741 RepID=UPI003298CBB4
MTASLMRLLVATAAVLSLASCTVFPEQPAHQIFQLPDSTVPENTAGVVDTTLRISAPLAVTPIDSNRILVKPDAHEVRAYQGARWSNRAPVMLGSYLLESFRRDGRVATVVSDTSPARSNLTLTGDLTRFQAEYHNGTPVIQVQLNLQLIDERTRETVSNKSFEVSHAATGPNVNTVVDAFGKASDELARQVIDWAVEQL